MVGIIHTPRTVFSIAKGLARRRNHPNSGLGGLGEANPFVSKFRAGLFDCDLNLHMNNAAYLSCSEYARWELCAFNGLMDSMWKDKVNFMVGGAAIRYRREIRPVFRQYEIHSFVARLDERYLWIYHSFRYPPDGKDPGRIRAHQVCQGLAVQGRTVLDPRKYLIENVGIDREVVEELSQESHNNTMADLMDKYMEMEEIFKEASAKDDEDVMAKKNK